MSISEILGHCIPGVTELKVTYRATNNYCYVFYVSHTSHKLKAKTSRERLNGHPIEVELSLSMITIEIQEK